LGGRRFRRLGATRRTLRPSAVAALALPRERDAGGSGVRGLVVDLFAGGGGASAGIESALGRPVDLAVNHSAVALAVHEANHPTTRHLTADIWDVDPKSATRGRPVALLWASPDCRHFSRAKSGVPRSKSVRS